MGQEVREGLSGSPKRLPSKYFYDERGSKLFGRITELPEYYLTRAEDRLLERCAAQIARAVRPRELVELGPGSSKKTRWLIDAARGSGTLRRYVPVEVSPEAARAHAEDLVRRYPGLAIHAVIGDFEQHLGDIPRGDRTLVAFLGSTIGNFPAAEAVDLLSEIAPLLAGGGALLLGADLAKDRAVLEAAYNDADGVTAEFNRNILHVLNRRLDGDFDSTEFEHVSFYNGDLERIESYLRSRRAQTVALTGLDLEIEFARGEMMRTEVSCKYTRASLVALLEQAGLVLDSWYTEEDEAYALLVARRVDEL